MEQEKFTAQASISIKAPISKVWSAITTPETIKNWEMVLTNLKELLEGVEADEQPKLAA